MRGSLAAVIALVGCAPAERVLLLPAADPSAKVALVALAGDMTVLDVGGPIALDDVPSFPLSDDAEVLVAFAIQPADHVDLRGEAIEIDGIRVVRASDPPAGCASCLVPRDEAPAIVGPGDRCPPPAFAPSAGRRDVDGLTEQLEPSTIELARNAIRIEWPGECTGAWEPAVAMRAQITGGCMVQPWEDPFEPAVVAQDDLGNVLAFSSIGGHWAMTAPDGRRVRGTIDLGLRQVSGLVALPELVGSWVVATTIPQGETRVTLQVVTASLDRLTIESTSVIESLNVRALSASRHRRGEFEALGTGRIDLTAVPLVVACRFDGLEITCTHPESVEMRCASVPVTRSTLVGGRTVATTDDGQMFVAPAEGAATWKCLNTAGRIYPVRNSSVTTAVRSMGPTVALGDRFFACVTGSAGTGLLTFQMPAPAAGDPDFAAEIAAVAVEVVRSRTGDCRGFVATDDPNEAVALLGDAEFLVDRSGRVRNRAARAYAQLVSADVVRPGSTIGRDVEDRVLRAVGDSTPEIVIGGASPPLHIAALAPAPDGFVAFQSDGPPYLIAAECTPRAPRRIDLDGLQAILTATSAGLEAFAEHEGIWWAWQRRGPNRVVLVRLDLGASRADTFAVEAPPEFAVTGLNSAAFLGPNDAIVTEDGTGVHRVHLDGQRAIVTPLALTPWTDDGVTEIVTRFRAASASGGVAWISGDGRLARVTAVSAEHASTIQFPREAGDLAGSKRSRHAGLVVLAPNHVMLSTRDVSVIMPFEVSEVITRDFAPFGRPCEIGGLGESLGFCIASESIGLDSLTEADYGAHLGVGPSKDPLLINGQGFIYGPMSLRGEIGFAAPFAIADDGRGTFAVAGPHGRVFIGHRATGSGQPRAVVSTVPGL